MADYGDHRRHRQRLTKLQEIEEDYKVEQRALHNKFNDALRKQQSQFRGDTCRMQRRQQVQREGQATCHAHRRRRLDADLSREIKCLEEEYRGQRLRDEKYAARIVHDEQRALQRRAHREERLALENGHQEDIEAMIESHRQEENRLVDRAQRRDRILHQRYLRDRRAAVELVWFS